MNIFSDTLITHFDPESQSIKIGHAKHSELEDPLVTIRKETYEKMTFDELSAFLGSRLLFLMPSMREFYRGEIDSMVKE